MLRLWPMVKFAIVFSLIVASAVLTATVRDRRDKFLQALAQQGNELQQTRSQLQETKRRLVVAEGKLGFLNQYKTAVQVTAFTGTGSFASGLKTEQSYAAPTRRLPADKVLSIALSPPAQQLLHARFNDYIVLLDRYEQKGMRLARFVDTTSEDELRPVVDIFFANEDEARVFGRQKYLAVNISAANSPFLRP